MAPSRLHRYRSPIPSNASFSLRRLGPADADAYRALRLRGLAEHPNAFTSSHDEEAQRPPSAMLARLDPAGAVRVYGAFANDTLAGVVGIERERRRKNRHKANVIGMYVAAEHAGRGIGAALMRRLIAEAREEAGLEQLVLTVTAGDTGALGFYEGLGFRSFGTEPRAIRVGDAYFGKTHMILFLDSP